MKCILYFVWVLIHFVTGENGGRIVGGETVFIKDYPYQAVTYLNISKYQGLWCGAIIISPEYLLTAAHCAKSRKEAYSVVIGVDFVPRHYDEEWLASRAYKLKNKIIHPEYDLSEVVILDDLAYDIAILTVDRKLKLNGITAKAIDLATQPTIAGTMAVVSGFGNTERNIEPLFNYNRYNPTKEFVYLKAAPVPVVDHNTCVKYYSKYPPPLNIKEGMICAGAAMDTDSCYGDDGGPLVANGKLIGIVSYSIGCAGNIPGMYTDVSKFLEFIREATNSTVGQNGKATCLIENSDLVGWFSSVLNCILRTRIVK